MSDKGPLAAMVRGYAIAARIDAAVVPCPRFHHVRGVTELIDLHR